MTPTTTYPKHAATVSYAESKVGQREEPLGSNTGVFVRFCQRHTWLGGTKWPWCRGFNLTVIKEGGGFTYPDGSAGAWDALDRARKRGWALALGEYGKAIPGDEVIWNIGSGHASILKGLSVRGGAAYVQSVDGNVSDSVADRERPLSLVRGFIHWPEAPVFAYAVKPPRVQVVGSASGTRKLVTRGGKVVPLPKARRVDVEVDGKLILKDQRLSNPAVKARIPKLIARAKRTFRMRKHT
jgi:hypothetical protein